MRPLVILIACGCGLGLAQVRQERSASAGLEAAFRPLVGAQPAWIGYTVAAVKGHDQTCNWTEAVRAPGPVHLEPSGRANVLFRAEQNQVTKIRVVSVDCELDAGGLPVYWLTGVRPVESVALLSGYVAPDQKLTEGALAAIAMHADPAADQALEKFAAAGQPDRLREKAAFWMGAARGRRGLETLRKIAREDPSDRVRERTTFALSISKEAEAVGELIRMAKEDRASHVRSQALFWLAQKAGKQAAATITNAIENDPETEVKKRAVFALQQMPHGEGIPKLIEVAKTNRNPAVRKQAMFWLGQSNDPRALELFEQVLK